jgi:hypothetical protein
LIGFIRACHLAKDFEILARLRWLGSRTHCASAQRIFRAYKAATKLFSVEVAERGGSMTLYAFGQGAALGS